ncbi:MAG: cob(I)yrinic acid a,c-diamide adenosyltransferase [Candidatus Micrarchaeales archaeon]|jgi:cob(I)alamin adenosyltransferase
MPYYTRKGDDGYSCLLGKGRVSKNDPVFNAIGAVDELNSSIGVALYYARDNRVRSALKRIQNDLFIIGAGLASVKVDVPKVKLKANRVVMLEKDIEFMSGQIPALKRFVIPGGCEAAVHLHMSRAIARRAERTVVAVSRKRRIDKNLESYMNRLSSLFFVAAIYLNYIEGIKESHPSY